MTDVPRIVLGNRAGVYGLWISKPGFDASNPSLAATSYHLNSQQALLSRLFYRTYVTSLPFFNTTGGLDYYTLSITHNLGYIPVVQFSANLIKLGLKLSIDANVVLMSINFTHVTSPPSTYTLSPATFVTIYRQRNS